MRALILVLLVAALLPGCMADLQYYAVRADLPAIDGATVRQVRLDDGAVVWFDSTHGVVRGERRAITGRARDAGDTVDIPFDRVAEADVSVGTPSAARAWLTVTLVIVGTFFIAMSGYSVH